MKKIIITLVVLFVALTLSVGVTFVYFQKQMKAQIDEKIERKFEKLPVHEIKTTTLMQESDKDIAFRRKFDSISLSYKILSKKILAPAVKSTPKKEDKDLQKKENAFVAYASIAAQRKADSLENVVNELSQMAKSAIILANQAQSQKPEKTNSVQHYYDNVSIVFRTRQTSLTAKVDQQTFSNFQYGQVFHFENSIPEYMSAFTDNKGGSISNEAAKKFLQGKSFFVNSIDLKNHNAVVKCSQNM